jgi:hypothetical protein
MFVITNIDTGEGVDVRDLNKANFVQDMARITVSEVEDLDFL